VNANPEQPSKRKFLFLQGYTNPFCARLGDRLRAAEHQVYRINFNVGDAVYWWGRPAWNFREPVAALPDFLEQKFRDYGFTDIVMLGDVRPVNRVSIAVAKRFGARVHVLEEGYFRPNWITLEEGGVNGYSRLPKDPQWYRAAGKQVPDYGDGDTVVNPLYLLALHELGYHLPNLINPLLFNGYRSHRPHNAAIEMFGWARRFTKLPYYERRDKKALERLFSRQQSYYLLPLQVSSDSQIQQHSRFRGVPWLIKTVIESFVRHAPENTRLVIKNHPLDTGLIDYADWIRRLQRRLNVEGRILYLESGHLPTLLAKTLGVITVNSSVGTSALVHQCPTIALGDAIYAMPGLTYQGGLDRFWTNLSPPDRALYRSFRNVVLHTTQINGGYWSREGIELGVANCCRRLEMPQSPLDALLAQTQAVGEIANRDSVVEVSAAAAPPVDPPPGPVAVVSTRTRRCARSDTRCGHPPAAEQDRPPA
jgi:capsular polysaccharide export protein